jgi:hypothetical protein
LKIEKSDTIEKSATLLHLQASLSRFDCIAVIYFQNFEIFQRFFGTRRAASTMILLPHLLQLTQAYSTFWTFTRKEDIHILPLPHAASGRALMKYVPAGDTNEEQQRLQSRPSLQRESVWSLPSHEATQNELGNKRQKLSIEEPGITTRKGQYPVGSRRLRFNVRKYFEF